MKTNTIKRAFAALAVSAVALSATAINASAETAVGYTSTGKAAGFTGASLELTQKTITLDEAKNAQMITLSAKSTNGTKFDSTGIHITYDAGLELVPITIKGKNVNAEDMQVYGTYKAVTDGDNGLFLTFGNDETFSAAADGTALWQFQLKVKNPEAGKKYPINVSFTDGDLFDLKGSADTEKIRDYAFSNVTQGYIEIVAPPTTTTTTATTTTTSTTTSTTTTTTTPTSSTTKASATTTKAATTTKKVSTTAANANSPKTGVPGAGIAVAGLAVAIGTAFVLRKKED
ncbi:NPXTG-anchored protein [Ruminococcus flavefaciens]|uniref:NPXTG-anchored protein n=1 Tax=Ruminococcus flavefaciens TaxID=1265 RepID=UPI0004917F0C|nr:NPXTG-anchored protein [Ruminococcus flavefaciens]